MDTERQRRQMLADIEAGVKLTRDLIGRDHLSQRVMTAMRQVPREAFVPDDMRHAAFRDGALPVGHGQTISQPYIVALMTDLLELGQDSNVLEIGSGTGYQAAILSCLARQVYSIERIPALAQAARQRLLDMGYDNVEIRCGDGYQGWPEKAPFDGIVVTAAAPFIPPALIEQLKRGGRMVIPIGMPYSHQQLKLVTRDDNDEINTSNLIGVAFVPLVEAD
ncbi:MAG: protein-L-isoaspartate(D-aspartate) O-methyltransferase [Gammaproteobacteria bacterium]|nr:protein-L-isoaspartate(D-aspartate) O-methyltransferase [Gammaproteobacteria bacterium]MDH3538277.1 protein-L-isoaspartate(D-aspartate) O-methyltransferase [Gammaproteobacteria bacterium]